MLVLGEHSIAVTHGRRAEVRGGDTRLLLDALERANVVALGTQVDRATFSRMLTCGDGPMMAG